MVTDCTDVGTIDYSPIQSTDCQPLPTTSPQGYQPLPTTCQPNCQSLPTTCQPNCQPLPTTPPQGYQALPTPSPPEYHIDDSDCKLSYSNLPDDYLKYSCNASGPNLSTQLFYADSSSAGNGIIDLANFVKDSKDAPTNQSLKLDYVKLQKCAPVYECNNATDDSGRSLLRNHSEVESEKTGADNDTNYTDLSSPDFSGELSLL